MVHLGKSTLCGPTREAGKSRAPHKPSRARTSHTVNTTPETRRERVSNSMSMVSELWQKRAHHTNHLLLSVSFTFNFASFQSRLHLGSSRFRLSHSHGCGRGPHHSRNTQTPLTRRLKQEPHFAQDHSGLNNTFQRVVAFLGSF